MRDLTHAFDFGHTGRRRIVPMSWAAAALTGCATPLSAPPPAVVDSPSAVAALSPSPAPLPPPSPASMPSTADLPQTVAEPSTAAADGAALRQRFARWVAAFRASARTAGIDEATLRSALDDVHFLPRTIELDRSQPEFTRPVWEYLDGAVSARRIATGREKLARWRVEADAAAARYGVPAEIVIAIWGLESNYGGNYGDVPTIDALATLGFDGRREDWARGQLIAALKILQSGDIDRARMIGSWAGAMGQTQFLPSSYLAYAVDADGDGRRDIWGSMADVIASTANFLARSGWQAGQPWGAEVRLPAGFDAGRADGAARQSAAAWQAEGVRAAGEAPLPEIADAALLLPAGSRGPAFLIGPNYRAILAYNNSTSYALAVGLLAQRLAGGADVQAPWPRDLKPLTRSQTIALQTALNRRGFDSGEPDGTVGPATRAALRRYQRSIGVAADGFPEASLLRRLEAP